jgi:radical SAM superfamily enzyme YgiQ (UPF0313 family)
MGTIDVQKTETYSLKMVVTLIQPPSLMSKSSYSTITQPPLGLAYLAASARSRGHEVHVLDAVGLAIDRFYDWGEQKDFLVQGLGIEQIVEKIPRSSQVIGLTCMFTHAWPLVRQLIRSIRTHFPDTLIIAGGEHITAMHDLVLREAPLDAVVLGEGEETLGDLLAHLERGEDFKKIPGIAFLNQDALVVNPRRARIKDVNSIPWPAWDLVDPMIYLENKVYIGPRRGRGRTIPMLASRGCPYQCTFCSSANMWTARWYVRTPEDVCNEIEFNMSRYDATDFQFQDLTAIVRKDWIIAFCEEILKRNLKITWQIPVGTRSEAIDEEVSKFLVRSGCTNIQYAPESGDPVILQKIKKRIQLANVEKAILGSIKAGMSVSVLTIVGFPFEDRESMKKTRRWIRKMARLGVHEMAVSTLVPLPATEIFQELNRSEKIEIGDEYCYWMAGATRLNYAKSWHPEISDGQLLYYKLLALFQFYLISWFFHPQRLFVLIRNMILGRQDSKVDRVIRELSEKLKISFKIKWNHRRLS